MSLTIRRLPEQDNNLLRPPTSISPSQNGDVVLEATANNVLTMKLKGTDGVVRNFDVGGGGSTIGTEYDTVLSQQHLLMLSLDLHLLTLY